MNEIEKMEATGFYVWDIGTGTTVWRLDLVEDKSMILLVGSSNGGHHMEQDGEGYKASIVNDQGETLWEKDGFESLTHFGAFFVHNLNKAGEAVAQEETND